MLVSLQVLEPGSETLKVALIPSSKPTTRVCHIMLINVPDPDSHCLLATCISVNMLQYRLIHPREHCVPVYSYHSGKQ